MFNAALIGLGQKSTSDVVGFMGWLLGSGNLISQTPPGLSYDNDAVNRLWGTVRGIANGGLAVVTVWGGVNLMIRATDTFPKGSRVGRATVELPRSPLVSRQ